MGIIILDRLIAKYFHTKLLLKSKLVFIAVMALAVIGATTFIFLEETISVSDRAEAENIEIVTQSEPIYGTDPSGEPSFGNVTVSISNLPNIGETAVVTVTNNDLRLEENPTELRIYLTSNLEFVDFEPTSIYHNGKISYVTTVDNTGKESVSFSATIRAIEEGNARIHGSSGIALNTPGKIQMVISENTRLGQDIPPRGQSAPSEDIMTKKTYAEGDLGRQTSECVSRLVTDEPFENEEEIDCVAIVTPWTKEEIRTNLAEAGETEEAIEHAIREAYPDPTVETYTTNPVLQEYFERMCKNYDDQTFYNTENLVSVSMDSIEYDIIGGELSGILYDTSVDVYVIFIDAVEAGLLVITIPNTPDDSPYSDASSAIDPAILLVNGEEIEFDKIITTKEDTTYSIPFPSCGKVIEIIRNYYFA